MDDNNGITVYRTPEVLPATTRGPRPVTRGDIGDFIDYQDVQPGTKALYRLGLERFFSWLETNGITHPDKSDIVRFKVFLSESGLKPSSVNAYLCSVKSFFGYLEESRLYLNIAKKVKTIRRDSRLKLRDAATVPQVVEMLGSVDTSTPSGLRDFAIINLIARCGLRDCEVVRADIEDIRNEQGKRVLWVRGKGRTSKDECVVLTEKAEAPIRAWLVARGPADPTEPLFCSFSDRNRGRRLTTRWISSIVKRAFRATGIDDPRLSAHSLRHFFITELIDRGGDVVQVQAAARHASVQTTLGYYHNKARMENPVEELIQF